MEKDRKASRTLRASPAGALTLAPVLLALLLPSAALAQQQAATGLDEQKLTAYARAFAEVSRARDDAYAELGRTHDTLGKATIRERLDERIASILETHALSSEEYKHITFVVSTDQGQREAFEKILAEVTGGGGGSPAGS